MEKIKLTNDYDLTQAEAGTLDANKVRSVEIEALVDTGATMMMLPADVVEQLGVPIRGHRKVRYADSRVEEVPWVGQIKIEIRGRDTLISALVGPAGSTPLIGQIPLEEMDFVVDPKSRELRPNPASPDAPVLDLLRVA
ncbi:MAG TPA: clan AA aspartic protease [Polyangia bacterium]|nr:clan AA aspartic protease [Polyangia bacterium]